MGILRSVTLSAAATLALFGCAREARLYPANSQAGKGALTAKFTDSGLGKGPVELTMPDGEVLKGEFSTTDTSTYGFGTAVALTRYTPVVSTASTSSTPGSMPGVLSAVGTNGTQMHCDYVVNSLTSSGSGNCQTNKGAAYELHF